MFKKLKEFIDSNSKDIIEELEEQKAINKELKEEFAIRSDPQKVVERILKREIKWIDTTDMSEDMQIEWHSQAKDLLENNVFKSLVGYADKNGVKVNGQLAGELIEEIARNASNWGQVRDIRMVINALDLVRNKVEEITDPKKKETFLNLHDAI